MPNDIIDLRKKSSPQEYKHETPVLPLVVESKVKPLITSPISPSVSEVTHQFEIEWSCYEHEYRLRGPYWFLYPLTVATFGIVFGIVTHSYLFVIFVCIAFMMLTYYANRPPRIRAYAIEKRGVWIEDKLMDYGKLKSFSIFTHTHMSPELLLETGHPINPFVHIRMEGINPDVVRNAISRYLPEKEHNNAIADQIARIIGF